MKAGDDHDRGSWGACRSSRRAQNLCLLVKETNEWLAGEGCLQVLQHPCHICLLQLHTASGASSTFQVPHCQSFSGGRDFTPTSSCPPQPYNKPHPNPLKSRGSSPPAQLITSSPPPCILLPAPPHGGAAPRQRACPEPRWRRRLLLLPALWWRARSSLCCLRRAGPEGGVRERAGMLWPSPCRPLLSVLLQPDFPLSSEGGEVCSYG